MRHTLIRDKSGVAYKARLALSDGERALVEAAIVPLIYYPGGMSPTLLRDGTAVFGGACLSPSIEQELKVSLHAFRRALQEELHRQREVMELQSAEAAGYEAFPAGRYLDALRGWKSYPDRKRCPLRSPRRATAWRSGYEQAHAETRAAFLEEARI